MTDNTTFYVNNNDSGLCVGEWTHQAKAYEVKKCYGAMAGHHPKAPIIQKREEGVIHSVLCTI